MTIKDFVAKATAKGFMPATVNDQNEKLKKELEVKSYLGIKEKKDLVESIIDDTIIYSNGLYKFNGIDQYVTYNMKCIEAYTNLELSDDIEEDYDELCRSGLLNKILRTFDEEYQSVLSLLQMQCDYILMDNSVTAQINVLLNAITVAINKMSDSASDAFKNVKPEDFMNILNKIK